MAPTCRSIPLVLFAFALAAVPSLAQTPASVQTVIDRFCVDCHDADAAKGGLNLAAIGADGLARHSDEWEKVVRRLRNR